MMPAAPKPLIDENNLLPLARIDAQDENYVEPLREYLELNGCRVVINPSTREDVMYHIVAGDTGFVKHIFATVQLNTFRRLGVMIGSAPADAEKTANNTTKIIVVDPVYLTQSDVLEIFSFFFAGIQQTFDKRRNIHELDHTKIAPHEAELSILPDRTPLETPIVAPVLQSGQNDFSPNVQTSVSVQENKRSSDKKRINDIMSDIFEDDSSGSNVRKKKRRTRNPHTTRKIFTVIVFACACIFMPVIWYVCCLIFTAMSLKITVADFKKGDISGGMKAAHVGSYWLRQGSVTFSVIKHPLVLVAGYPGARGQERLISLLTDVLEIFSQAEVLAKNGQDLTAHFLSGLTGPTTSSPAASIEQLQITSELMYNRLGLAEAQLNMLISDGTFPFQFPQISTKASEALQLLQKTRNSLSYIHNLLTLYPQIAGFTAPKTYLVLLQNSNELRPTGGFIGSIGIARFEAGNLADFTIQDVYALDGQLRGHAEPPGPIRDLLGQEHWYLRDSNWDPDFRSSALKAQWFYEKETGEHPDGVIAINVPVIVNLLKATGPIQLPDYNDRITADNFFGKSFYYTQSNFFPGSTQKKDFLGTLSRALITKITTDKDVELAGLFDAFADGITARDIAFMFDDAKAQALTEYFGWAGRIFTEPGCVGVDVRYCLYDPVAISEANLSVSKVNYFIRREGIREMTFSSDGSLNETVTMTVQNTVNTSPDADKPGIGGAYVAYYRFLLPQDSNVKDIRIGDAIIASRKSGDTTVPKVPYIEKTDGPAGTSAFGVAMSVAPGEQSKLQISYSRSAKIPFGKGGGYVDLKWYKHPGIQSMPLKTIIQYPLYWVATNEPVHSGSALGAATRVDKITNEMFVAKDGQLEYNNDLQADTALRFKFIK